MADVFAPGSVGVIAMKIFTSYVVAERGAKVAPLPKSVLRFYAIAIIGAGAFLLAWADSWWIRIGLCLALLVLVALSEREARSTIEFTEEGVLLRNGWRKKTITWSRFDGFAVPTPRFGAHVGRIVTIDGDSIRSQLLRPIPRLGRGESSIERAVAALNEAAAKARPTRPSGGA
jgi:hypothetical protein